MAVPVVGIGVYSYNNYNYNPDYDALPIADDIPNIQVTYKKLPQYGKNFKVGQVSLKNEAKLSW